MWYRTYLSAGLDLLQSPGDGDRQPHGFYRKAGQVPEFGEKSLWVAIVIGEKLRFQEIEYGDLTGLFGNLNRGDATMIAKLTRCIKCVALPVSASITF